MPSSESLSNFIAILIRKLAAFHLENISLENVYRKSKNLFVPKKQEIFHQQIQKLKMFTKFKYFI